MTFYFLMTLSVLIVVLLYLIHNEKEKKKLAIKRMIDSVINVFKAKIESGDKFAALFDANHMATMFLCTGKISIESKFPFLESRFEWSKKLVFDGNFEGFWNKYNEEKKKFESDKRYKLYNIFINNLQECGSICEFKDRIYLTIQKYWYPPETDDIPISSSPSLINIMRSMHFQRMRDGFDESLKGQLRCPGFEKMRAVWDSKIEKDDCVEFIVRDSDIEDFCNICEVMCSEDLTW